MSVATENYLLDLGSLVKRKALDIRTRLRSASESCQDDFELGQLAAYYEVISLMRDQALIFELSEESLSLAGFDPDTELLESFGEGKTKFGQSR